MPEADPLLTVSVLYAAVTATAGFAFAVLAREPFSGSPFGRLLDLLAVLLFVFAGYHALLLVVGRESIPYIESVAFTGLLIYVVLMIRLHHRLSRRPRRVKP